MAAADLLLNYTLVEEKKKEKKLRVGERNDGIPPERATQHSSKMA